jgi:ribosomal protein S18 acetylase RimI-like enzyme
LRELQVAELPFNEHLKPPAEMDAWYIELLKKQCSELAGLILVVEEDKQCLGAAVILTRIEEKGDEEEMAHAYAHISELIVTKSARGRGIGKALLDECERRAKLASRDEMTIAVLAENESAHRLYQSSGYADVKIRLRKKLS